jgi:CHASE2 domain-containing sensor protein
MSFGWKVMVPLSLAIVFITATGILLAETYGSLWMWTIPVASTLAGLVAVMFVFRALRRKAYERA